jgi:hypothetical protein
MQDSRQGWFQDLSAERPSNSKKNEYTEVARITHRRVKTSQKKAIVVKIDKTSLAAAGSEAMG